LLSLIRSVAQAYVNIWEGFGNATYRNFYWLLEIGFATSRRCKQYETYWGRHVKCPIFLSDFNQNGAFSGGFRTSFNVKIQWKSAQWEPGWYVRACGRTDTTKINRQRFSQLRERAQKM